MKKNMLLFIGLFLLEPFLVSAQTDKVDSIKFFTDESIINISLTTDYHALETAKGENAFQDADVVFQFADSSTISEKIKIAARGHFRRATCSIPPLLLNFKNSTSPHLSPLGKLKLVIGCLSSGASEMYVLKEYLCYKIYNLLEDKSFRARLVRVTYHDSRGRIRAFTQYAFFLEDDKRMAARNGCETRAKAMFLTDQTNRAMMTKVGVYEYFISNGDWSVPNNHNIKLIYTKGEQTVPFAVPYDFDHSGFVNADYAVPDEILGTEKVTERVYRGFPRNPTELQPCFDDYRNKKDAIIGLINDFSLLSKSARMDEVSYVNEFYKTINNSSQVKSIFMDHARKE